MVEHRCLAGVGTADQGDARHARDRDRAAAFARGTPSRAAPGIDLDQPRLAPAQAQFRVLDPVDGRITQRGPPNDLDADAGRKPSCRSRSANTEDAAAATPTMVAR